MKTQNFEQDYLRILEFYHEFLTSNRFPTRPSTMWNSYCEYIRENKINCPVFQLWMDSNYVSFPFEVTTLMKKDPRFLVLYYGGRRDIYYDVKKKLWGNKKVATED